MTVATAPFPRCGRFKIRGVEALRPAALAAEQEFAAVLDAVASSMRESDYNLVHDIGVRRIDARELQNELTRLGLSIRIMETTPGEAADDPALIRDLVDSGIDVMRVKCARQPAGRHQSITNAARPVALCRKDA